MNSIESDNKWNEYKTTLTEKFEILSDDDRKLFERKKDILFGKLLNKLGKTKEELHNIVTAL
jgi:uncharacterized protein YjbJ (UPF0337 family)